MLVLSRRTGETIVIDDNISVSILAVKGSRVRIGVDAPRSVPVRRQELDERSLAPVAGSKGVVQIA